MITAFTLWLNSKYDTEYSAMFFVTFIIDIAIIDAVKTIFSG